ncbi:MAG: hypothetical protein ABIN11_06000 [candidate division WOR-3 bacterium]
MNFINLIKIQKNNIEIILPLVFEKNKIELKEKFQSILETENFNVFWIKEIFKNYRELKVFLEEKNYNFKTEISINFKKTEFKNRTYFVTIYRTSLVGFSSFNFEGFLLNVGENYDIVKWLIKCNKPFKRRREQNGFFQKM